MIRNKNFFSFLKKINVKFFCGVPDSVLKSTNEYFSNMNTNSHVITHNEGAAVALAAGYYLKTKKIACVYLQNSGLGNIVNPVLSLTHKKVYSIPILFLIGYRGFPNSSDEPQHYAQGIKTVKLLNLLGIKSMIVNNKYDLEKFVSFYKKNIKKNISSAILIKKGILTTDKIKLNKKKAKPLRM